MGKSYGALSVFQEITPLVVASVAALGNLEDVGAQQRLSAHTFCVRAPVSGLPLIFLLSGLPLALMVC